MCAAAVMDTPPRLLGDCREDGGIDGGERQTYTKKMSVKGGGGQEKKE